MPYYVIFSLSCVLKHSPLNYSWGGSRLQKKGPEPVHKGPEQEQRVPLNKPSETLFLMFMHFRDSAAAEEQVKYFWLFHSLHHAADYLEVGGFISSFHSSQMWIDFFPAIACSKMKRTHKITILKSNNFFQSVFLHILLEENSQMFVFWGIRDVERWGGIHLPRFGTVLR